MKRPLLISALLLSAVAGSFADWQDFEAGFNEGWAAGWKHMHGEFSIAPIPPIPAIPPVGRDSFGEGFIAGEQAVEGQGY